MPYQTGLRHLLDKHRAYTNTLYASRLDDELTVEQLWYMLRTQFDMLMPDSKAFTLDELKRYQTLRGLAAQW